MLPQPKSKRSSAGTSKSRGQVERVEREDSEQGDEEAR